MIRAYGGSASVSVVQSASTILQCFIMCHIFVLILNLQHISLYFNAVL